MKSIAYLYETTIDASNNVPQKKSTRPLDAKPAFLSACRIIKINS